MQPDIQGQTEAFPLGYPPDLISHNRKTVPDIRRVWSRNSTLARVGILPQAFPIVHIAPSFCFTASIISNYRRMK